MKKTRNELVNLTIYWLLVYSSAEVWNELREAAKPYSVKDLDWFKEGYNEEQGYCFFDGIPSKVLKTPTHKGYTLYETPFEFVAQQGTYTAHGKTVKQDLS